MSEVFQKKRSVSLTRSKTEKHKQTQEQKQTTLFMYSCAFCADLRQAVWPWLKDDQQYSNGHSDLLQLQVVCNTSPAQNPANTVLRGHRNLTQTDGQTVQLRRWQTEPLQHSWRQPTCNITQKKDTSQYATSIGGKKSHCIWFGE